MFFNVCDSPVNPVSISLHSRFGGFLTSMLYVTGYLSLALSGTSAGLHLNDTVDWSSSVMSGLSNGNLGGTENTYLIVLNTVKPVELNHE